MSGKKSSAGNKSHEVSTWHAIANKLIRDVEEFVQLFEALRVQILPYPRAKTIEAA